MKLPYDFSARAARDIVEARGWYDRRGIALGDRFVDAVLAAVQSACDRPNTFPVAGPEVRAVRCKRFPFRVYFAVRNDRIDVLAVYHTARDPRLWDDPNRP